MDRIRHSRNKRSSVRSTSQASPSSAALAPEVKVPQLLFATQRVQFMVLKEMLLGCRNAALLPKLKSTGKTAILLCLTKAKLGKSYYFYSGKSNCPGTQHWNSTIKGQENCSIQGCSETICSRAGERGPCLAHRKGAAEAPTLVKAQCIPD